MSEYFSYVFVLPVPSISSSLIRSQKQQLTNSKLLQFPTSSCFFLSWLLISSSPLLIDSHCFINLWWQTKFLTRKKDRNIVVLDSILFRVLDRRREDRKFPNEFYQVSSKCFILLISFWIRHWFLNIASIYMLHL